MRFGASLAAGLCSFDFTNVVFDEPQIDFDGDFDLDELGLNDLSSAPPARPRSTSSNALESSVGC
jgi:hypothetical protein